MHLTIRNLKYSHKNNHQFQLGPIEIEAQQSLRLCGKNGAGKTTLLKCVAGLLQAKGSEVLLNKSRKFSVVWVGSEAPVYWETLTGLEYILLQSEFYGTSKKEAKQKINNVLENSFFKDAPFLRQNIFSLSTGQKKILSIISALVCPAQMLAIDEPDSNIDKDGKEALYQLLFDSLLSKQKFILFSSHEERSAKHCHHNYDVMQGCFL